MKHNQHINFKRHYSKLNKDCFTTVRWTDKPYKVGRTYDILCGGDYYLRPFLCNARIYKIELKKLSELTNAFCQSDADCNIDGFFKMMKHWYQNKPDWKEFDSEIQVIYLEKVKPLNSKLTIQGEK